MQASPRGALVLREIAGQVRNVCLACDGRRGATSHTQPLDAEEEHDFLPGNPADYGDR